MATRTDTGSDGAATELREAHERLRELREDLDLAREDLEAVADAYESVERVLERWEERATDWDDFQGYVEFRDDLSATLESIPEDVPASEAFLEADGHVKTGSATQALRAGDFEAAREALAPAREYAEYREELAAAREDYREARSRARRRREALTDRIEELERLVELSEADLEAPVGELRGPIAAYDDAVREAFAGFRGAEPARAVLEFAATAAATPLVEFEAPPERLLSYAREAPAGDRSVDELLEYSEYSTSKLSHYVDDADRLKRRVATNRTYLERLSADPLEVGWPPPERDVLRYRTAELVSLVGRLDDAETVAALRRVQELPRREDYERLRTAAVARAELTDAERERVESGAVETELENTRERLRRLEEAIEAYA